AAARREAEAARLATLRDELCAALAGRGARIFSVAAPRLPNTVFFAVEDIDGETLVGRLDRSGFACASGSACSSANPEPSHTLLAMGVEPGLARAAVRVSLGRDTRADDVRSFIETFVRVTDELKNLASIGA
ncbi:MAG TPA: aminotransferase class V-fold PLP-dependent enzyme, partial [Thauera phenylacetica]|nr:aminotransferase class V-fold PLP-dependent enzyme [Thauera phenylacetica]